MSAGFIAVRLLLAAVFLFAGAAKIVNPAGLREVLPDFGLPSRFASPVAKFLPVLELLIAAALIPASTAWYGAWGSMILLTIFTIAAAIALWRGRKPDCGCFGQLHSAPIGSSTLIRNGVLAVCGAWVVSAGRGHAGPALWTWAASLEGNQRRAAILAACGALFCFFYVIDHAKPDSRAKESPEEADADEVETAAQPPAPEKAPAMGIGLPMETPAPEFALSSLNGEMKTLQSLQEEGKDILLIFSSPYCESCVAVAAELPAWIRQAENAPNVAIISRGAVKDNLAKFKGFDAARVLLQREFEVSEAYDCISTPTGVLIGADGLIRSGLAVGGAEIRHLLSVRGATSCNREQPSS
ncbi:MAG TPA: MauE/DoxX family redox-associated membrane protein [Terriglobia bacterium]|jgi:uncharacterized membrane protein YphA (DoxX/SURF4 family)